MDFGVGNHIKLFIKAISKIDDIEKILLIGPEFTGKGYEKTDIRILPTLGRTFLTKQPYYAFAARKAIQDEINRNDYDIIHVHFPIMAKDFNVPLVSTFHTLNYQQSKVNYGTKIKYRAAQNAHRIFSFYDKSTIRFSNCSIFASKSAMEIANNRYNRHRHKFVSIPNFVDTSMFIPFTDKEKEHTLQKFGLDPGVKYLLYTGRLEPMKGIGHLVDVYKRSIETKNSRLLIVGDGPLRREICSYKFVDFLGRIPYDSMPEVYNLASIFIMPSLYENFPMSVLEAMSCGLPVISSKVGDVPFIIENEEYLFEPGNQKKMRLKLDNLLKMSDVELRGIGTENRKRIVNHFGLDNITQIIDIYNSLK